MSHVLGWGYLRQDMLFLAREEERGAVRSSYYICLCEVSGRNLARRRKIRKMEEFQVFCSYTSLRRPQIMTDEILRNHARRLFGLDQFPAGWQV
jgi:hypothetical protein